MYNCTKAGLCIFRSSFGEAKLNLPAAQNVFVADC